MEELLFFTEEENLRMLLEELFLTTEDEADFRSEEEPVFFEEEADGFEDDEFPLTRPAELEDLSEADELEELLWEDWDEEDWDEEDFLCIRSSEGLSFPS